MVSKPCPVDRGKLLIALECCRTEDCRICKSCPYHPDNNDYLCCDDQLPANALAYINYLEEQLNAKADGSN